MTTTTRRVSRRPSCRCPLYCRYCGAKRRQDHVGHYCPTAKCQWHFGYAGCTLPLAQDEKR